MTRTDIRRPRCTFTISIWRTIGIEVASYFTLANIDEIIKIKIKIYYKLLWLCAATERCRACAIRRPIGFNIATNAKPEIIISVVWCVRCGRYSKQFLKFHCLPLFGCVLSIGIVRLESTTRGRTQPFGSDNFSSICHLSALSSYTRWASNDQWPFERYEILMKLYWKMSCDTFNLNSYSQRCLLK